MAQRRVILALVLLGGVALRAGEALATAQAADSIVLDFQQYPLLVNPLNQYISRNPNLRPRGEAGSSANSRGYVAYFAIVGDELHVVDVWIRTRDAGRVSAFAQVFPLMGTVRATWFTGHLVLADGKLTKYVHSGYASEYEGYIVIRVEAGRAGAVRRLTPQEFQAFKRSQFEAWKQTEWYRRYLTRTSYDPSFVEKVLFQSATAEYLVRITDCEAPLCH